MARLPLKDAASSRDAAALVAAYVRAQPSDADTANWVEGMAGTTRSGPARSSDCGTSRISL